MLIVRSLVSKFRAKQVITLIRQKFQRNFTKLAKGLNFNRNLHKNLKELGLRFDGGVPHTSKLHLRIVRSRFLCCNSISFKLCSHTVNGKEAVFPLRRYPTGQNNNYDQKLTHCKVQQHTTLHYANEHRCKRLPSQYIKVASEQKHCEAVTAIYERQHRQLLQSDWEKVITYTWAAKNLG